MDVYSSVISSNAKSKEEVIFGKRIALRRSNASDVHIIRISRSSHSGCTLVNRKYAHNNSTYAQVYLSRNVRQLEGTLCSFYICAIDTKNENRLAVARIDVNVRFEPIESPKFDALRYFARITELPPHFVLFRVSAR
ncbi:hypothetical protein AB6A40_008587 [Gnathostoma spinigerum]|uniref:Uncharacterized protein n=1 Tax=Gnathostoma spinigerum TaxID=75299 RepID=A0ABD6EPJ6_9BILA